MNEKNLTVLEQYDISAVSSVRGRGSMICKTRQGLKVLKECAGSEKKMEAEAAVLSYLKETCGQNADAYVRNKEGTLTVCDREGCRYVLKDWFLGRECDISKKEEIFLAIRELAKLHLDLKGYQGEPRPAPRESILSRYEKHNRELKQIQNYLKKKKKKTEFELLATNCFDELVREGVCATQTFVERGYAKKEAEAVLAGDVCHGEFTYHHVLIDNGKALVLGFEKCCTGLQVLDLYDFMRKIMEKYDWNLPLGYQILENYHKIKPLEDWEVSLLVVLLSYPEKFWKLMNSYFSSNKVCISCKNMEKLKVFMEQNEKRKNFVEALSY